MNNEHELENMLPDWAIAKTPGRLVRGAQLSTRNGHLIGNAHIIDMMIEKNGLSSHKYRYTVLTDAGTKLKLISAEIAQLFYPPMWVSDVNEVMRKFSSKEDSVQTAPVQEPVGRTDRQIVDQTEELAVWLLSWCFNHQPETDTPMRESTHPFAERCWAAACHIQEMLTATDPENSVAELDVEDAPPAAQPAPVQQEQGEPAESIWIGHGHLREILNGNTLNAYCSPEQDRFTDVQLYTTPQQRTWIGLTDEQKKELWHRMTDRHSISQETAFTLIELTEWMLAAAPKEGQTP